MKPTRLSVQYVVLWMFCVLFSGLPFEVFAQPALPPLTPVSVSQFTIPFELADTADMPQDVELLVSKDRGRYWYSAGKQSADQKKFLFNADFNGEYWFAFRTHSVSGDVSPIPGVPQLRVLVSMKAPAIVVSPKPSESGPLTPPKPIRYREGKSAENQPKSAAENDKNKSFETALPDQKIQRPSELPGPLLPGFEISESISSTETDVLDSLLSGMSPFLDVEPAFVEGTATPPIAAEKGRPAKKTSGGAPPGGIIGIFLNNAETKPQIFVRWNTGAELWQDAQVDVFRCLTKEGQQIPIAINLPNNGEYWWYLTQEDLKPFYIALRIRSLRSGMSGDITQTAITIDPQIPLPKSASLGTL